MRSATDRCRGRRRRPEQTTSPTCSRPCSWCPATKRSTDIVTCQMTLLTGCSIAVNADTCRVHANSPMCGVVWPGRFPAVSWWFRCRWSVLLEAKPGAGAASPEASSADGRPLTRRRNEPLPLAYTLVFAGRPGVGRETRRPLRAQEDADGLDDGSVRS